MANEALAWAWKQKLDTVPKMILVYLADRADENFSCFPGQKKIAEVVGVSDRTVRTRLDELERAGLIVRERRSRENGSRTSDRFHLAVAEQFGLPEDTSGRDAAYRKLTTEPTGSSRPSLPEAIASGAEEAPEESSEEEKRRRLPSTKPGEEPQLTLIESGFGVHEITTDDVAWAKSTAPHVDPRLAFQQFMANAELKNVRHARWKAAWKTWIIRAEQFAIQDGAPLFKPPPGRTPDGKREVSDFTKEQSLRNWRLERDLDPDTGKPLT